MRLQDAASFEDAEEASSLPIAEVLGARLDHVLQNVILEGDDLLDDDELNEKIFNRYDELYFCMHKNVQTYGYAKSPDFRFKREWVQRSNEKQWLKHHGLGREERGRS